MKKKKRKKKTRAVGDMVAVIQKVGLCDICSQWHMPGLLLPVSPNAFPALLPDGMLDGESSNGL